MRDILSKALEVRWHFSHQLGISHPFISGFAMMATRTIPHQSDLKESRDQWVLRVRSDPKEIKGPKDQRDHKEMPEHQDLREIKGLRVRPAAMRTSHQEQSWLLLDPLLLRDG